MMRAVSIEKIALGFKPHRISLLLLMDQGRVVTDAEVEGAGESSRKMRELQQKLARLEQELTRNGDGLSIQQMGVSA